ncbi:HEAT repeat domain-containing protein [Endozoicomonas numazuensis]|uniref:HEAT repeat domain-containing protein n=1 Tax=Endozoicomonas numazuensis TaxID=1137799 RepID=A0A081NMP0_9GAMM|nr:HEAT repeat domain-containing protein [Endozoicomonas numazuensis]KEQ19713.1 hypothetical protein GZ78_07505 [Endozoicomonas numazuensis]
MQSFNIQFLEELVTRVQQKKCLSFSERYIPIFQKFNATKSSQLLNSLLLKYLKLSENDDLKTTLVNGDLALARIGDDFHMTIKQAGMGANSDLRDENDPLRSCEFDILIINLSQKAFSSPYYTTDISKNRDWKKPSDLKRMGDFYFEPWKPFYFKAYEDLVDLDAPNGDQSYPPCLIIRSESKGDIGWLFDRNTGKTKSQIANHLNSSRIQLAARVIGMTGDESHTECLVRLARESPDHHTRWEAIQQIYHLNPDKGKGALYLALQDEHPHIRKAAQTTLFATNPQPGVVQYATGG